MAEMTTYTHHLLQWMMDGQSAEAGQVHDEGVIHQDHRIRLLRVIELEIQENPDHGLEVKFSKVEKPEEQKGRGEDDHLAPPIVQVHLLRLITDEPRGLLLQSILLGGKESLISKGNEIVQKVQTHSPIHLQFVSSQKTEHVVLQTVLWDLNHKLRYKND